jgi:hypothetical protein
MNHKKSVSSQKMSRLSEDCGDMRLLQTTYCREALSPSGR